MNGNNTRWQIRDAFVPLTLTGTAGFVDAVGYLTYVHIYTANMSGNSVAIGIGIGTGNLPMLALRLWPVIIYVVGLISGRLLLEVAGRLQVRRVASIAFACEIAALAMVARSNTAGTQWLWIALLAWAMGVQNAVLTRFSSLTVHTGFVTGTLLKLSEQLVKYGTWLWDRRKGSATAGTLGSGWRSGFLFLVWISYVLGAAGGAWARGLEGTRALIIPILVLLFLMVTDLAKPLAVQDEKEQTAV